MDMAQEFILMGMTRAKRYANYKSGRKYIDGKERGDVFERSDGHKGKEEREEASRVFRTVWERRKSHEGYQRLKAEFWLSRKRGRGTISRSKMEKR